MIDIKKKVQAAKDYASKSYRTIKRISQHGSFVERDKDSVKHFLNGIEWAEEEFLKDLWHSNTEKPEVGKKILVYTIDGYETITYVGEGEIDSGTNWMDIVSDMAIACWCYPEVLCPKKGGDSK